MRLSILRKDILPFVTWFILLILVTILLDVLLHYGQRAQVGRYLGIVGTFIIILSFLYSLAKRKIIRLLPLKQLLRSHEILAWLGCLLVLVHAGKHFNAVLPWLATISMLISISSGFVGGYLLRKARNTLKDRKSSLSDEGVSPEEIEKRLFLDILTVKTLSKWRRVHMPITLVFFILAGLHIVTVLIFWSWY